MRYHLEHRRVKRVAIEGYLDDSEHAMLGIIGSAEFLEPMIIISGGGLEKAQVDKGRIATAKFIQLAVENTWSESPPPA